MRRARLLFIWYRREAGQFLRNFLSNVFPGSFHK